MAQVNSAALLDRIHFSVNRPNPHLEVVTLFKTHTSRKLYLIIIYPPFLDTGTVGVSDVLLAESGVLAWMIYS
jgi:hypothetical protein